MAQQPQELTSASSPSTLKGKGPFSFDSDTWTNNSSDTSTTSTSSLDEEERRERESFKSYLRELKKSDRGQWKALKRKLREDKRADREVIRRDKREAREMERSFRRMDRQEKRDARRLATQDAKSKNHVIEQIVRDLRQKFQFNTNSGNDENNHINSPNGNENTTAGSHQREREMSKQQRNDNKRQDKLRKAMIKEELSQKLGVLESGNGEASIPTTQTGVTGSDTAVERSDSIHYEDYDSFDRSNKFSRPPTFNSRDASLDSASPTIQTSSSVLSGELRRQFEAQTRTSKR
jgi:hypothetical protein